LYVNFGFIWVAWIWIVILQQVDEMVRFCSLRLGAFLCVMLFVCLKRDED